MGLSFVLSYSRGSMNVILNLIYCDIHRSKLKQSRISFVFMVFLLSFDMYL